MVRIPDYTSLVSETFNTSRRRAEKAPAIVQLIPLANAPHYRIVSNDFFGSITLRDNARPYHADGSLNELGRWRRIDGQIQRAAPGDAIHFLRAYERLAREFDAHEAALTTKTMSSIPEYHPLVLKGRMTEEQISGRDSNTYRYLLHPASPLPKP